MNEKNGKKHKVNIKVYIKHRLFKNFFLWSSKMHKNNVKGLIPLGNELIWTDVYSN